MPSLKILSALLATLVVVSCVQNRPLVESEIAQLQAQFYRQFGSIPQEGELPEDKTRESYVYRDAEVVPVVPARTETKPVTSIDDAADDPAIWIHPTDPNLSLVLGTDKKAGIAVYNLAGELKQFLPAGLPNNIDLRQEVSIGEWQGDLAISSNRADNTVTLFKVTETGVATLGAFPVDTEPYGICMGSVGQGVYGFVTYKTGLVKAYQIDAVEPAVVATEVGVSTLPSQLEGCVHDDMQQRLWVGEEAVGIWYLATKANAVGLFGDIQPLDKVGAETGLVADVEGLTLYDNGQVKYLIASSQGDDSYAVYDGTAPYTFRGRFRIGEVGVIDGAQETDGIAASGASIGSLFPEGFLVVQDGFNAPMGSSQNFKMVDWRAIKEALGLSN